jgi:hypothetical protein
LTYNLLRAALLAACVGLGWLAGLRSFVLIIGSLLVSGILSWFLLRSQREAMGRALSQTVDHSRARLAERTRAEDEYVDAVVEERSAPTERVTGSSGEDPSS